MKSQRYAVELFAGSGRITKAINHLDGWKCFSIDFDPEMKPDICMDIFNIKSIEHLCELLGIPRIDFIWASPDCTSYSLAAGSYHRLAKGKAKSDYAILSDKINWHLWNDILIPANKKTSHILSRILVDIIEEWDSLQLRSWLPSIIAITKNILTNQQIYSIRISNSDAMSKVKDHLSMDWIQSKNAITASIIQNIAVHICPKH